MDFKRRVLHMIKTFNLRDKWDRVWDVIQTIWDVEFSTASDDEIAIRTLLTGEMTIIIPFTKMENQKNILNLKQRSLEIEWMSYLKVKINKLKMLPINYVKGNY
jgi:hypothetical protein